MATHCQEWGSGISIPPLCWWGTSGSAARGGERLSQPLCANPLPKPDQGRSTYDCVFTIMHNYKVLIIDQAPLNYRHYCNFGTCYCSSIWCMVHKWNSCCKCGLKSVCMCIIRSILHIWCWCVSASGCGILGLCIQTEVGEPTWDQGLVTSEGTEGGQHPGKRGLSQRYILH